MKLLEYEAKTILKTFGIPIPKSSLITKSDTSISIPTVLKSQVPVGGRGKAGGVRLVEKSEGISTAAREILSLAIKGHTPKVLLAEEPLSIRHEYYLSLVINKSAAVIELMAHKEGGIEVEEQSNFKRWPINEQNTANVAAELADYYDVAGVENLSMLLTNLFRCFAQSDATLLEINPLILTVDNKLVAGDCKMTLDDAARFRHPEWDFEDTPANANFVTLDPEGSIATIANGAGLAMATVDAVADAGFTPANFLDVGGGANEASVLAAFEKIMEYPNVSAIVINIFAGITRCDEVAKAIISAKNQIPDLPKLYIRLAGTNYEAADDLLTHAGIPLLPSLADCLVAIQESSR